MDAKNMFQSEINQRTSGVCHPPLESLTEEEVALLAEYGISSHYDDLLSFPASSTHAFGYQKKNFFLTGTTVDDGNHEISRERSVENWEACEVDSTWPLECLLLRHTTIISSTTAESLWNGVNEVLKCAVNLPLVTTQQGELLNSLPDGGEGVVAADNCLIPRLNDYHGDDNELLEELNSLLREAEDVIARRRRYVDPMSSASILQQRKMAAAEEERCWSPFGSEDNTATDVSIIMATEDYRKEENGEVYVNGGVETLFAYEFGYTKEEENTMREWDEAVKRSEKKLAECLAKNTFSSGKRISETEFVDDGPGVGVGSCLPSLCADEYVESSTPPQQSLWAEQHSKVLESIAEMEIRDSERHAASCKWLDEARQQRRRPRYVPSDQIVFECFTTRVDALLPPNEMEVKLRAVAEMETEKKVEVVASVDESQLAVIAEYKGNEDDFTVEQLQKKLQRDCFRAACEAQEAWHLQNEDERAILAHQIREERLRHIEKSTNHLLLERSKEYENIIAEEEALFLRLSDFEQQGLSMLRQKEENERRLRVVAQLSQSLLEEHGESRREIIDMEENVLRALLQKEFQAREILLLKGMQSTEHSFCDLEDEKATKEERKDNKEGKDGEESLVVASLTGINDTADEITSQTTHIAEVTARVCSAAAVFATSPINKSGNYNCSSGGNVLRWTALLREECMRIKWLKECTKEISSTATYLANSLKRVGNAERLPFLPNSRSECGVYPITPYCAPQGDEAKDAGVCLDACLARQLNPRIFGCAKSDPRELAQICHSFSFALEQITSVDLASLCSLEVHSGGAGSCAGNCTTPAASLVRELDFGGNLLTKLPLDDLLRVFPSLRSLNISDNKLKVLTCRAVSTRGVSEAHAHSLAQTTQLVYLNASMNELQTIETIGKLLSYHLRKLVIYANQIGSLLPLASCGRLELLEASRNKIRSLSELQHLFLLQTLDLGENCLTDMDSLANHVLLQHLYLSRNQIQAFPKALFFCFLRQLFLNENLIEELPGECFCWIPFLTVLHVENNKLRSVSGLMHCSRLTDVSIAFNRLQQLEDILPLTACKRLQRLSVIENPFLVDDHNVDGAVGEFCMMSRRMGETILAWFPQLCELNNEKVRKNEQRGAMRDGSARLWSFFATRELMRQYHEGSLYETWQSPCCLSSTDVQRISGTVGFHLRYVDQHDAYTDMFTALTSDAALNRIQKEQDILATIRLQRYNNALYLEEELQERMSNSMRRLNPVVHRFSDKIEERNQREKMLTLQQHLASLQTMPRVRANMHVRHVLFHERAQTQRETRAKAVICKWMHLWQLRRLATKELETLRAAREELQRQRYEVAARVIQPVWRGAAFRSRLRRILHPSGDDAEGEFAYVSLPFDEPETACDSGCVGDLLQRVLQAHVTPPNFPITKLSPQSPGVNVPSGTCISPYTATYVDSQNNSRYIQPPRSSPSVLSLTLQQQRQEGQEQQRPLSSLSSQVDEEWGALVSSQLRKRQKKRDHARRERMRREFMSDPLRVRREIKDL